LHSRRRQRLERPLIQQSRRCSRGGGGGGSSSLIRGETDAYKNHRFVGWSRGRPWCSPPYQGSAELRNTEAPCRALVKAAQAKDTKALIKLFGPLGEP
jgi:hypothetical protein